MPAPAPTLTLDDVRRFVDDHVFESPTGGGAEGRVGIELEWIPVPRDAAATPSRRGMSPEVLGALLPSPLPGGSRVTFEPGGQLELSGQAGRTLADACTAMRADTAAVRGALDRAGINLVGVGVDSRGNVSRVIDAPRYRAMEEYFDTQWPSGRTMMRNTAAVQVNLDLGPPAGVDARWRLAHDLGPVLSACFANSPFDASGTPTGFHSTRLAVWAAIDPARTSAASRPPRDGARTEWTRYLLAAPVMMIRVDDGDSVAQRERMTFEQWVADGHRLGWPTVDDVRYHLTTLFPPVRPRGWLELRMIDALPEEWWPVAVAVTTALLDDPIAAEHARRAVAPVRERWHTASRDALGDPALHEAALRCFAAARDALSRLRCDQATQAATSDYAERYVEQGRCPADDLLDDWSQLRTVRV
jgi:glutamate--cysteine ligase